MRIATGMLTHLMPVCAFIGIERLRTSLEPVRYNYSRDTLPWEAVLEEMRRDAIV